MQTNRLRRSLSLSVADHLQPINVVESREEDKSCQAFQIHGARLMGGRTAMFNLNHRNAILYDFEGNARVFEAPFPQKSGMRPQGALGINSLCPVEEDNRACGAIARNMREKQPTPMLHRNES